MSAIIIKYLKISLTFRQMPVSYLEFFGLINFYSWIYFPQFQSKSTSSDKLIGRKRIAFVHFSVSLFISTLSAVDSWNGDFPGLLFWQELVISCAWHAIKKSASPMNVCFVIKPGNVMAFLVSPVKIPEGLQRHCQMNILVMYALVSVGIIKSRGTWDTSRMEENWHYGMLIYLGKANFRFIHTLC